MNIGSLKHSTAKKTQRQLKIYSNNPKHFHFVVSRARFLAARLDKTEKSSGKTWLFTWHSDQTKLFSRKQIDLNPLRVWKDWFWEEISLLVHLPPSLPPRTWVELGLKDLLTWGSDSAGPIGLEWAKTQRATRQSSKTGALIIFFSPSMTLRRQLRRSPIRLLSPGLFYAHWPSVLNSFNFT